MSYIFRAIGAVLSFFNSFLGSYLLAVLLFALVVKVLMLPFGIKQQKNSVKQASLRPKEMAIRKKYVGRESDREAQNQMQMEIQNMYRANNYNQFAGCLPMLIQLPIILIVYQAIYRPLSYIANFSADQIKAVKEVIVANAETLKITLADGKYVGSELDMANIIHNNKAMFESKGIATANIPDFDLFGVNLGDAPSFYTWMIIIPVLVFAAQFLSSKLIRKMSYQPVQQNGGCATFIMDFTMPLMIAFMAFTFPAFLGIYWIFQSLLGVGQQFILKKMYPYPTFTDQDYRDAERAMRGKGPKGGSGTRTLPSGKTYRSLHHIDDDDE
ncbi:MAG: YidC/Oxa1 family membrane protein insertase [Clostridia bacterium]|nr:YidC/Oxa1 family membrane protein insertase [Clostridia bacterium]